MSNLDRCSPVVTNCTFSNNEIVDRFEGGGGMSNEVTSSPRVINTIFWGNLPEQVYYDLTSIQQITYSLIEGGSLGMGNIEGTSMTIRISSMR
jgi:hypothetical protein